MKLYVVVPLVAVLIAVRVSIFRRRRHQRDQDQARQRPDGVRPDRAQGSRPLRAGSRLRGGKGVLGDVGIIAGREIRERVKGRLFRVGTLIILVAVAAAIIIPKLHSSHSGPTVQKVAVVGSLAPDIRQVVAKTGSRDQDLVRFVSEPSLAAAKAGLRSGRVYVAIVDGNEVLLNEPASLSSSPADPTFVQEVADLLGVLNVYRSAGLTTAQATQVSGARPVPVHTLKAGSKATTNTTSLFGIILLFVMLTQYNTWILIGVMQEKSSRVVEVLLATVRPIQLLGGKVLGIGLVALGQATVIVGFALILAAAVGSDLLHGSAPLVLICQLLWLVLGYAFYCWVYAAGGSTAERQDQVQTLAFPLSIPILVGYIFSLTVAGSGNADLLYKILAYLPPTAPFCMPVLVSLNLVTWWQFVASVLITIAATAGMAVFAARIYGRAVLRTGGRVRLRDLFQHAAH
jgi:ABC-2 type transport system permease protein